MKLSQRKDAKMPSRKEMKNDSLSEGARLWSQIQPQRVGVVEMLRLALRAQSRSKLCISVSLRLCVK